MKTFSGFLFIFAVGMILNAFQGVWAFDRVSTGTKWVVLDVAIGLACLVGSYLFYRTAKIREYMAEFSQEEYEELRALIATAGENEPETDSEYWDRLADEEKKL